MLGPVVDLGWLATHRAEVVLADVRWYLDGSSGQAAYGGGHLPGAVFVDLDRKLADRPAPERGRHPLPDPTAFAVAMSGVGVGDDTPVVAYDDQGGTVAARLVWMLRALGRGAALLDGGLGAYEGPLERSDPGIAPRVFTARPWPPELLAGVDDATDPANVVLDGRSPERFRGDEEPIDARAGHIPGARSLPCRGNLDDRGRFQPADALRRRFEDAGARAGVSVVAYCGSGVNACHNLLALELAGLGRGRLYPGSWSHYSRLPGRPVATGDAP